MTSPAPIPLPAPPGFVAELVPMRIQPQNVIDGYRVRVKHEGDPWQEIPAPKIKGWWAPADVLREAERVVAEWLIPKEDR